MHNLKHVVENCTKCNFNAQKTIEFTPYQHTLEHGSQEVMFQHGKSRFEPLTGDGETVLHTDETQMQEL